MSDKTKKIIIVEVVAIVLSLLPLLLLRVIPAVSESGEFFAVGSPEAEPFEAERVFFVCSLCIYLVYPLVTALTAFFFAFFQYEWYLSILPGVMGFILSSFIMRLDVVTVLVFSCVCALAGLALALPTAWLRAKHLKKDEQRYGRRL